MFKTQVLNVKCCQRKVSALKNELGVCQRRLLCNNGCYKIEVGIFMKELAILIIDEEERVCLCVFL